MKTGNLRREEFKQYSGKVALGKIACLKESDYIVLPVTPDGDAPKQYIRAYFYYKSCPRRIRPGTWDGYYAKFGLKSYPHESIVEYAINQIGDALGLNMNKTRLVVANGQVRFLSKDFIAKGKRLIHGTEILAEYFEDRQFVDEINQNRRERRELLTFDVVAEAITYVYKEHAPQLLLQLVRLITFDAIVGNNDRHFYNWGVIGDITRDDTNPLVFAPIYDSARGLLWNTDEAGVIKMHQQSLSDKKLLESYCDRSKPRFSFSSNAEANHFELIKHLASLNTDYRNVIATLVTVEKEQVSLRKLHDTVSALFSKERVELMRRILSIRFLKIREVI